MDAEIYSIADYAAMMEITPQAVYKAVKQHKLKTVEKVVNNRRQKFIVLDAKQPEVKEVQPQDTSTSGEYNQPARQPKRKVKQPEVEKVEYLFKELEAVRWNGTN